MKNNSLFLSVLFLGTFVLAACSQKTSKSVDKEDTPTTESPATDSVVAQKEDYVPLRSDYTFRSEVRTIDDEGTVCWDTIVVYMTDAKGQTQRLYSQAQPLDTMYWSKNSIGEISENDWNFDNIPDLQVCMGPMNGFGNFTYDVWIWDDNAHKFVPLECEEPIFDPTIESDNKCIVSFWRLDDDVEIVRFKWKDGKLVVSEREQMSYSDLTED